MNKITIGIDMAKDHFEIALLDLTNQRIIEEHTLPNTTDGHNDLLQRCTEQTSSDPGRQIDRIVIEATGTYHRALVAALIEVGLPVSLLNPLQHRRFAQMKLRRTKTDRIDARSLAHYGAQQQPPLYKPQSEAQQQLKQLATLRQMLVKQRTMASNFLHAYRRVPQSNEAALELAQGHIAALNERIKALEAEQDVLVDRSFDQVRALMLSVSGIGRETMVLLVAYLGDLSRFKTAKQVSAFVGLNPALCESGQYKGQVHISKQGHKRLRQLLYLGAQSASRWNPSCKGLFDRLRGRGRPVKVAYVAVANKLLRQVFAVVHSGQPYQSDYEENRVRRA